MIGFPYKTKLWSQTVFTMVSMILLASVPFVGSQTYAGEANAYQVIQPVLSPAPAGEFIILVHPREKDVIKHGRDEARRRISAAEHEKELAGELFDIMKSEIDIKKEEIETLKARIDAAKEKDEEAKKLELERTKKKEELELKLLEQRKKMREKEVHRAEAARDEAKELVKVYEKELELLDKREDLRKLFEAEQKTSLEEEITETKWAISDLQRRVLKAMKEFAKKQKKSAEREEEMVDNRLKLLEAQNAVLIGPK